MNKKHIKEKITYQFDIDSFEKDQAYQLTLATAGLERATYVGILVYVDLSILTFMVVNDIDGKHFNRCGEYGHVTITIDEYVNGDISIRKLGVVENDEETPDATLIQDQDGNIIKLSERRN